MATARILLDFDAWAGQIDGFYTVGGWRGAWGNADEFADGMLVPCGDNKCGGREHLSAVSDMSWGRIKATFR